MRIGIDVQSLHGPPTGTRRYTSELIEAMRRLDDAHEYIELYLKIDAVMHAPRRLWWQQRDLPRQARKAGLDVAHATGFDAPLKAPCPVVHTVHDLVGLLEPRLISPPPRWYWSRWVPFTISRADKVIVTSRGAADGLLSRLKLPAGRVSVIPLGVSPAFHPRSQDEINAAREKYNLPEHCIFFMGNLDYRKGFDILTRSFVDLPGRLFDGVVLVGKPGYKSRAWLRAARAFVKPRMVELGHVPEEDLPAVLSACSVMCLPSRHEGFGLPVLEAMACGLPVVCSTAGALPETAGEAALFAPPGDAQAITSCLKRALSDASLREELSAKGLDRARLFTWESAAKATLDVYRELVDQ